jgi:hypothetical protein
MVRLRETAYFDDWTIGACFDDLEAGFSNLVVASFDTDDDDALRFCSRAS